MQAQDLSSITRTHIKKTNVGVEVLSCHPSTGKAENGRSMSLSRVPNKRPCLIKQGQWVLRNHSRAHLWPPHMCTHFCIWIQEHTRKKYLQNVHRSFILTYVLFFYLGFFFTFSIFMLEIFFFLIVELLSSTSHYASVPWNGEEHSGGEMLTSTIQK